MDDILYFLKRANADVIALQEVIQEVDGTGNIAGKIAEELGYEWVYFTTERFPISLLEQQSGREIDWGNAIVSKYKILEKKVHILSEENSRTAVEAVLDIEGKPLSFFSTHLFHTHQKPSKLQELQTRNLLKIVPKERAIVAGDFNALPESGAIKIMEEKLTNADKSDFRPSWSVYPDGCRVCRPEGIIYRLDYIFGTKDVQFDSFAVEQSDGADHLPISVKCSFL
jgi:endonuclease/exonuclease/phosphatase family metal-dependent hydrolase